MTSCVRSIIPLVKKYNTLLKNPIPRTSKRKRKKTYRKKGIVTLSSLNYTTASYSFEESIKSNKYQDAVDIYLEFKKLISPIVHRSDVRSWWGTYLCICDSLKSDPSRIISASTRSCIQSIFQTNSWYETSDFYTRSQYEKLRNRFILALEQIEN